MIPRIAVTPGEPAGIGPDLIIQLCQQSFDAELVAIADSNLLKQRAEILALPLTLKPVDLDTPPSAHQPGVLRILHTPLNRDCAAGTLDPANADYVLRSLQTAVSGCQQGNFSALVTGPVHKGNINDAGIPFSGHTEFLAEKTDTDKVVMMLATESLRVALVTTHLPLSAVPSQITKDNVTQTLAILDNDLRNQFGIKEPRILVLGLNPHAGENGHMGREELDIINPVLASLREKGMHLTGPLPADTAFTPKHLSECDAVLAMYHDQGLPVLKYQGFGQAVNITLGLPIIRTSVDHGTALELAGTGKASTTSLLAAINMAISMAAEHSNNEELTHG